MSSTEQTIDRLVEELKPFKTGLSYKYYAFAITLLCVLVTSIVVWFKQDFVFSDTSVVLEIALLTGLGLYCAFLSFRFSDLNTYRISGTTRVIAGVILIGCLSIYFTAQPDFVNYLSHQLGDKIAYESHCAGYLLGSAAAISAVIAGTAIFKLAPVKNRQVSWYAAGSGILFGTVFLRAICPASGSEHYLLWHYLPALLGFAAGYKILQLLIRRSF